MSTDPMKVVLLGTAGGPLPSLLRSGIAQAVVAGGRTYLVDCGNDVTRQLRRARLLSRLHQVFVTHLHSDHTCDYFNVFFLGWPVLQWNPPVDVYGPGSAGGVGALPLDDAGRSVPLVQPDNPTPGIADLTDAQIRAHAYDLNIRMRESGRHDLTTLIVPHDLEIPAAFGARGPDSVSPPMDPILVAEDDHVRVTATLVRHAPVFPAFAYRFDTADGSVVFSGDTAPCPNLVRLAQGTDLLVHEVYDDGAIEEAAPGDHTEDAREEARRRHHMVTSHTALSEVGGVAAEAGARRLVLTHFVPGDDALPDRHWIDRVSKDFDGEVVVGHDLLELTV